MRLQIEEKLDLIAERLNTQNIILSSISKDANDKAEVNTWKDVQDIVRLGVAERYFSVGDHFTTDYNGQEFVWTIVDFQDVVVLDSMGVEKTVPGMILQAHYATLESIQFDHEENEVATESTFTEGYYYYTKNSDGSYKLEDVNYGDNIVGAYYHSAIRDTTGNICKYGYNNWKHSAYRQWLNSDAPKGEWWTPQHLGDVSPNEHTTRDGFMKGFTEKNFLDVLGKTKQITYTNTVTDGGVTEETFDTFFLPSVEQMYGSPQISGEGKFWQYWKNATNLDAPSNSANDGRKLYAFENHTSAQTVRLRSANRGNSANAWNVTSSGSVNSYYATYSLRSVPACVIC